jgi:hypothetical protein
MNWRRVVTIIVIGNVHNQPRRHSIFLRALPQIDPFEARWRGEVGARMVLLLRVAFQSEQRHSEVFSTFQVAVL